MKVNSKWCRKQRNWPETVEARVAQQVESAASCKHRMRLAKNRKTEQKRKQFRSVKQFTGKHRSITAFCSMRQWLAYQSARRPDHIASTLHWEFFLEVVGAEKGSKVSTHQTLHAKWGQRSARAHLRKKPPKTSLILKQILTSPWPDIGKRRCRLDSSCHEVDFKTENYNPISQSCTVHSDVRRASHALSRRRPSCLSLPGKHQLRETTRAVQGSW